MHLTKLFLVLFLIACVGLVSCGGSGGGSSTPPPTLGSVNGNWHLAGTAGTSGSEQLPTLNLAIGVSGDSIYGFGDMAVEQNCANVTSVFENTSLILSGSVSSSGTFVLTNPIAYDVGVQVKGQIPLAGSTNWTGSYTMANSSQYDCTVSSSNTFSATAIPSLTGTFTGTVVGTNITLSADVTQGAAVVDPTPLPFTVSSVPVYVPLSGTITVGGVSCFTTGTTSSAAATSYTTGDEFILTFTMSDGSTLVIKGSTADNTGNSYYFGLYPTGGECSTTVNGGGTLTR